MLRARATAPFTYDAVGSTANELTAAPPGYVLDRYGVVLGRGVDVFDRARRALSLLRNYPPSFTRVVMDREALAPDALFATVAAHLGFASVHPCRVIRLYEDEGRYGVSFGTLRGHAESGEERFLVSMVDEVVRYDVQAFSRPHAWLARIGAPITRGYQRRFQRETLVRMGALSSP